MEQVVGWGGTKSTEDTQLAGGAGILGVIVSSVGCN